MELLSSLRRSVAAAAVLGLLATAANAQSYPWTTLSPTTSPTSRERVGSATDGTVLYLYGGQNSTTTNGYDSLWSFDGADWTQETASGASCGPRCGHAMAWDSARGKLVVFGGQGAGGVWGNLAQDTWEWDSTGGWVQMTPATTVPDARWFASDGVYVPGLGLVMHGGHADDGTGTSYTDDQTWAWDGLDWSVIATGPEKKNHTMVYRPATNDIVLFGGNSAALPAKSDETWKLDLGTLIWTQVVTTVLPTSSAATGGSGLVGATGYLNANTGKFILHGGQGNGGGPSTYTWEFDGSDWTDISDAGSANIRNSPGQWLATTQRGYALCGNSSNSARNWTQEHGPIPGVVVPFCFGDGSSGTDCPGGPGNNSLLGSGEGCINGTGVGSYITASGVASVSVDSLVLQVEQAVPSEFGIFVQNISLSGAHTPFYNGLFCLTGDGHLVRHYNPPAIQPTVTNGSGVGVNAQPMTQGDFLGDTQPGVTIYYQFWGRDNAGPAGAGANFSAGVSLVWLP